MTDCIGNSRNAHIVCTDRRNTAANSRPVYSRKGINRLALTTRKAKDTK